MLRRLSVKNLAVLAGGEIELAPGLNVLTGETGAGKSLVVDSLALLAGARAAGDLIREGTEGATVSGIFECDEALRARLRESGIEVADDGDGDELVIRREISREGRNRVYVQDQPVTLRLLQELAPRLLRIHGQRDELGLADPELQRQWLDRLGGEEGLEAAARVAARYAEHALAAERLERLQGDARLRAERIDLLRFQLGEIAAAQPVAGEEEELRRSRDLLRHREAIVRALGGAFSMLYEGDDAVADRLATARHGLAEVVQWEATAAAAIPELDEIAARVQELARELRGRLDAAGADSEPGRLDEIEDRLALLERLFRKYGATSSELLESQRRLKEELAELDDSQENRAALEQAAGRTLEAYRAAASQLSRLRAVWATELVQRLERELTDLALARARFGVSLETTRRAGSALEIDGEGVEFGPHGFDRVVFQFAPNPGEPMMPLSRIASGGELARVSLALQLAARGEEVAGGPTMVFDEADAGVGGAEGSALGKKLRRLAKRGQILAVTHLAQVASCGHVQHRVTKRVRSGRTFADVERLDRAERVAEIARMLSGEKVTALSRSHAEEMLIAAGEKR
ncbi:MAG: DNA repair protein RecN [Thermoanaerobaculia bacterium]|nr:DNA repair protein RecN [Thermoanaerobaculia bacterium]MBP9823640.1 DNA repair protein RecN [Thermoanaerobaculia bacterium]